MRAKVSARLLKNGNNPVQVEQMVNKHFEYASNTYKTLKSICECIVTL